jgi:hypothetical protein
MRYKMQKIFFKNQNTNNQNMNINFKGRAVNMDAIPQMKNKITDTLAKLVERAEKEVPEYGSFNPVQETFKNPDKTLYAGDITFKIAQPSSEAKPDNRKARYFEVIVYTPSGVSNSSEMMVLGTKKEVLDALRKDDLIDKLEQCVNQSAEKLKSGNYA